MIATKKFYLTKKGLAKIEKEYQELKKLRAFKTRGESPRIFHSEEIDPEFLAFQEDLGLLNARIADLEMVMKNVQIINSAKVKDRVVSLGSTVVVEVDGEKDELKIVGTLEANPVLGYISNECPVGRALLGRRIGDEIVIHSMKPTTYKIKKIIFSRGD